VTVAAPAGPPAPVASVGRRARAGVIDLCVVIGGEVGVLIVGGVLVQAAGGTSAALTSGHVSAATAMARALLQTGIYVGPVLYLYLTWSRGASVGMRAVGCRLRSADTVSGPTSSQVVLRLCGLWLSLTSAGVGLLWGLTRSDHRGWSDLFARTAVVHLPPERPPAWGPSPGAAIMPAQPPPLWPSTPPPAAPPSWPPGPPGGAVQPWRWAAAPSIAKSPRPRRAPIARTPWTWSDVAPVVVLLLPLSLGVEYVTVAALKWLLRGVALATRRPIEAVASDITAYGAVFLLVLLFVKVRRHAGLAALGMRRVEWRWMLAALPFTFAAFLLESITGLLSQSLFPATPANQCVNIREAYQGALPLAVLGVAVIAPLVEEIVFRGMVFGWLRGRLPIGWAVVVSAALFSLEHIGFLQLTLFLPIFATGLVLATLYHHAHSIWPTVLVHATFNLVATLVLFNATTC
jgi:membrane protease YdiL (CAAX protease family)/uncharacterized RDD family membrane protein YckC